MKKHFISLALLCVFSSFGYSATILSDGLKSGLRYWWGFDGGSASYTNYTGEGASTGNWTDNFAVLNEYGSIYAAANRPYASPNMAANSFTVSMDVRNLVSGSWANLFNMQTGGGMNDGKHLSLQVNGNKQLVVYTGADFYGGAAPADACFVGGFGFGSEWDMVTLTYDGSILSAYANGLFINSVAFTMTDGYTLTGMQFGSSFGGGRQIASADVDNIGIWNRALSASEVAELYGVAHPIPEPASAVMSVIGLTLCVVRRRR